MRARISGEKVHGASLEKYRLSPEQFFGLPVLPDYVLCDIRFPTRSDAEGYAILTTSLVYGTAPRLSFGVYKVKANDGRWYILHRYRTRRHASRARAAVYIPVIRIKLDSRWRKETANTNDARWMHISPLHG